MHQYGLLPAASAPELDSMFNEYSGVIFPLNRSVSCEKSGGWGGGSCCLTFNLIMGQIVVFKVNSKLLHLEGHVVHVVIYLKSNNNHIMGGNPPSPYTHT